MKRIVLDGICVNELLFTFGVMFFGGVFHGLLGFGFPMIATPLFSLISTVQQAVVTTLLPTLSVNGASVLSAHNPWPILRRFWPLGLMIVLGSGAGTHLLVAFESEAYKLLLATMIILYLNQNHLNFSISSIFEKFPFATMLGFGLLSGIVSGLVNVMIPVLIIYILELGLEKKDTIILMNFCFFSSKLTQIITFSLLGVFTLSIVFWGVLAAFAAIFGLVLGKHYSKMIDAKMFTKILRFSLWLMAFMLYFQYFKG